MVHFRSQKLLPERDKQLSSSRRDINHIWQESIGIERTDPICVRSCNSEMSLASEILVPQRLVGGDMSTGCGISSDTLKLFANKYLFRMVRMVSCG